MEKRRVLVATQSMAGLNCVLLALSFLPSIAAGITATPEASTGSYTISWPAVSGADSYRLKESLDGGDTWTSNYFTVPPTKSFSGKSVGFYTYQAKYCTEKYIRGELVVTCFQGSNDTVTATVAIPADDTMEGQLSYEYETRTGDFNNDGKVDILIDRLTAGTVDGSLQTTILYGAVANPTVVVPTQSELNTARTFPVNSSIKLGGMDQNFDGHVDLLIDGLDSLGSTSYPYDCLILFASGRHGVAQPLGRQFIDEDYTEFFGNLVQSVANPSFFDDNTTVTIRPVFDVTVACEYRIFFNLPDSLWSCGPRIELVGYEQQVTGIGYMPEAKDAKEALDRILSGSTSGSNPWFDLSVALQSVLGVPSLGWDYGGNRYPTNRRYPGNTNGEERYNILADIWAMILRRTPDVENPIDPENYERHEYEVLTTICTIGANTTIYLPTIGNGPYGESIEIDVDTIPASVCTLDNVFCWAKRNPAPRSNGSEGTITDGEDSVLMGGNPIRTHVFSGSRVLVNETLPADVINGIGDHILHDPLQSLNCAENSSWGGINSNSPRCAYVHREVTTSSNGNDIVIRTHGEGNNPPVMGSVNEVAGDIIFGRVDKWIQQKMATEGDCTDDP